MDFVVLGSCTRASLPLELDKFLKNGKLFDPRNSDLMEMDSYPLMVYAIETKNSKLAEDLAKALKNNLNESTGFWKHKVWSESEVHLRFTSSGIRSLILAYNHGFFNDIESIKHLLGKHFEYIDQNELGTWFLHDSLEQDPTYFAPNIPFRRFGFDSGNMVILNTHLDTLITLKSSVNASLWSDSLEESSIDCLYELISYTSETNSFFWNVDHYIRAIVFALLGKKRSFLIKLTTKVIVKLYFLKIRLPLRNRHPIFFHKDGYTERDLCLTGHSFEYHAVNLWDMSKFCWIYRDSKNHKVQELRNIFSEKIIKGIDYIVNSSYFSFVKKELESGKYGYVELCETIVILCQMGHREESLFRLYVEVRKKCPPSVALKYFDPLVNLAVDEFTNMFAQNPNVDVIKVEEGSYLMANMTDKEVKVTLSDRDVILQSKSSLIVDF